MSQFFPRRPLQQIQRRALASMNMCRIVILSAAVALLGPGANVCVASTTRQTDVAGKSELLFCAYGPESFKPPGSDVLAVAVVQVSSSKEMKGVSFSDFELLSGARTRIQIKRLLSVEKFEEFPRSEGDKDFGYYQFGGITQSWNGVLPAGTIALRIRAAFARDALRIALGRCSLKIARQTIEGAVDGVWPSG